MTRTVADVERLVAITGAHEPPSAWCRPPREYAWRVGQEVLRACGHGYYLARVVDVEANGSVALVDLDDGLLSGYNVVAAPRYIFVRADDAAAA